MMRHILKQYLKEMEDNFILYLSTCFQTDHKEGDVCQLLILDVRSDDKGGFIVKPLARKDLPHEDGNVYLYTNSTLHSMHYLCMQEGDVDPDDGIFYFDLFIMFITAQRNLMMTVMILTLIPCHL